MPRAILFFDGYTISERNPNIKISCDFNNRAWIISNGHQRESFSIDKVFHVHFCEQKENLPWSTYSLQSSSHANSQPVTISPTANTLTTQPHVLACLRELLASLEMQVGSMRKLLAVLSTEWGLPKMDAKLLAENLSSCPIIPTHYRAQTIAALGGTILMTDATSRQGGTHVENLYWEDKTPLANPFEFAELHNYCQRNDIFYTIFPAVNNSKKIHIYVQDKNYNNSCSVGITLEGTFAAALVLLRNHDDS